MAILVYNLAGTKDTLQWELLSRGPLSVQLLCGIYSYTLFFHLPDISQWLRKTLKFSWKYYFGSVTSTPSIRISSSYGVWHHDIEIRRCSTRGCFCRSRECDTVFMFRHARWCETWLHHFIPEDSDIFWVDCMLWIRNSIHSLKSRML